MPELALRTPETPHRQRFSRSWRRGSNRSPFSRLRRSRMVLATFAVAGAATLGACTPAEVSNAYHTNAVNIASHYIGTPYVYGAAAPGGFDCSGLTQYVYARAGKYLPRSAEQQFEYVQKVPQSWAQKGDLIFFGTPGSIYHVGLYVGNGVIEHAPHTGTNVQFTQIWTNQYYVGRV